MDNAVDFANRIICSSVVPSSFSFLVSSNTSLDALTICVKKFPCSLSELSSEDSVPESSGLRRVIVFSDLARSIGLVGCVGCRCSVLELTGNVSNVTRWSCGPNLDLSVAVVAVGVVDAANGVWVGDAIRMLTGLTGGVGALYFDMSDTNVLLLLSGGLVEEAREEEEDGGGEVVVGDTGDPLIVPPLFCPIAFSFLVNRKDSENSKKRMSEFCLRQFFPFINECNIMCNFFLVSEFFSLPVLESTVTPIFSRTISI